jgi:hypothetical protein
LFHGDGVQKLFLAQGTIGLQGAQHGYLAGPDIIRIKPGTQCATNHALKSGKMVKNIFIHLKRHGKTSFK